MALPCFQSPIWNNRGSKIGLKCTESWTVLGVGGYKHTLEEL